MNRILITAVFVAVAGAAPASQKFTGTITDDMCGAKKHDAQCIADCVTHMNAKYALYDGHEVYVLSDQKAPARFADKKVTVTGTLDAQTKTIHVEKIEAAR
ncbi:MAG TPA: DUF5818 domain-containing protein [Bryobacteraceae bacterium]|nr:DUF5818 domain-containing protein [Bryobacteraceae bacterium]